jgi:16S rRNA processing protein RimM
LNDSSSLLPFGEIVNIRGLRGELKIKFYNPESPLLSKGTIFLCEGKEFTISKIQNYHGFFYAFFESINSCTEAEKLKGKIIYIHRKDIHLPEGEYLIADLIGFAVFADTILIGTVEHCINLGAGEILVIRDKNTNEVMIPFNKEFVVSVDRTNKSIYVKDVGADL